MARDRLSTTEHGNIDDATAEAIELGLGDDDNYISQKETQDNG